MPIEKCKCGARLIAGPSGLSCEAMCGARIKPANVKQRDEYINAGQFFADQSECKKCFGKGTIECTECGGDGSLKCEGCLGTGECGECGHAGGCQDCDGEGGATCDACDGECVVECICKMQPSRPRS